MLDDAAADRKPASSGYVPLRWVSVVLILLAAFVYLTGLTASPDDAGIAYQTTASIAIIGLFTGVIVFCVLSHRRYVGTPLLGWPGLRRFLLEAIIALPVALVWALFLSLFVKYFPDSGEVLYRRVIIAPVIYCLVGATLGPFAEEMLYRGVLYGSLRRWLKPVFAMALQAMVFGVMHRHGLLYISIAFGSGLLFMGLYLWRRTLWSPVLTHGLVNSVGLISLLLPLLAAGGTKVILGISMADARPQPGEIVTGVIPGTPAEDAKIKLCDVITAIDGVPIHHGIDVKRIIGAQPRRYDSSYSGARGTDSLHHC